LDPVLQDFLSDPAADLTALHDVVRIKAMLEQCARQGRAISYSELLLNLGFRFTRPKMRQVCKALDKIDQLTAEEGVPALAVLVVREGDGLPGQGWWTERTDYQGEWTGPQAQGHVQKLQGEAFDYWGQRGE
jgi:hypothetical protein